MMVVSVCYTLYCKLTISVISHVIVKIICDITKLNKDK